MVIVVLNGLFNRFFGRSIVGVLEWGYLEIFGSLERKNHFLLYSNLKQLDQDLVSLFLMQDVNLMMMPSRVKNILSLENRARVHIHSYKISLDTIQNSRSMSAFERCLVEGDSEKKCYRE